MAPCAGDLSRRSHVLSLAEDPVRPGLLYAGTEFGVFGTIDDGAHWFSLQLNLPTVPVHDILVHPRERDVVLGTHGRGIWILDSSRALEGLTAEVLASTGAVFEPRPTTRWTRFDRGRSSQGDAFFRAPNPPDGVYLDYYVNPAWSGDVSLEILDAAGERVRALAVPDDRRSGLQRVIWDMRADPPEGGRGGRGGGRGGGQGGGRGGGRGSAVDPGRYQARLTVGTAVSTVPVVLLPDPG